MPFCLQTFLVMVLKCRADATSSVLFGYSMMKKSLNCINYFCCEILPHAQSSDTWTEELILKALKWSKLSKKSLSALQLADILPKSQLETKSLNLQIISDATAGGKSLPVSEELDRLSSILKRSRCSLKDVEHSVTVLFTRLLLNASIGEGLSDFIRQLVRDTLSDEEQTRLWMNVDQIKSNREHLAALVEDFENGGPLLTASCHHVIVGSELQDALLSSQQSNQLVPWLNHHIKQNSLYLCQQLAKGTAISTQPNFLWRLLKVLSQLRGKESIHALYWLSSVQSAPSHSCFGPLLVQWLTIFPNTLPSPSDEGSCLAPVFAKVLVSLLSALFVATKSFSNENQDNAAVALNVPYNFNLTVDGMVTLLQGISTCQSTPACAAHVTINSLLRQALGKFVCSSSRWPWHQVLIQSLLSN